MASFLKTKLEYAISTDELRPAMCCACFKDGFVYATNGIVAVKQSLKEVHSFTESEIKLLDGKMLHGKILKKLHGHGVYRVTEHGIEADSGFGKATFHFHEGNEKYPDVEAILPRGDEAERSGFGLNPRFIDCLSK